MFERKATIVGEAIDLGIIVRDIGSSLRFYREFLGLVPAGETPLEGGPTLHQLACGPSTIKLLDYGHGAPSRTLVGTQPGLRYWTVRVHDLDDGIAAWTSVGHELVGGPIELADDTRVAVFSEGNKLELLERRLIR